MEQILKITEQTFKIGQHSNMSYDGFLINTNRQVIMLGITNTQSCCERWGYFMSEDEYGLYEGSTLIDITVTDKALNTQRLRQEFLEIDDCMFVNLLTDKGMMQFVAYNSHNGYYGHQAIILSETVNESIII